MGTKVTHELYINVQGFDFRKIYMNREMWKKKPSKANNPLKVK